METNLIMIFILLGIMLYVMCYVIIAMEFHNNKELIPENEFELTLVYIFAPLYVVYLYIRKISS